MKAKNLILITVLTLISSFNICAQKLKDFGVYIKSNDDYIKFVTLNNTNFPEFKDLNKAPSILRGNNKVELILYWNNFKSSSLVVKARKLALGGFNETINFSIEPLEKENMYKLTTDKTIPDGSFLFILNGWDEILTVFLGDSEQQAITFFSDTNLKPAYAAVPDLEDAIKAFPNSQKLADLLPKWKEIKQLEQQELEYEYVEEAWQKYQKAEKISLKIRYLKDMQMALNNFLANHPESNKSVECKKRQTEINTKLPELEKMM
ncbi:hypothetical protein ATE84_1926 [Aquimarina sp. MAR_2010_214]|uniref:hypothetical protein n=1 Tax=Aquimarina sp. MAR_2010_214 TaxID=1250026 RepID=UPI000C70157B|nr:hypothetical protein [Aquimarina sp. MAR_2010_214]PKV49887.1 hypothetical protein ATE84_1926 [Aquimarina sp. MAR_2010_214]